MIDKIKINHENLKIIKTIAPIKGKNKTAKLKIAVGIKFLGLLKSLLLPCLNSNLDSAPNPE
ncbi:MAG: hypothetical protein K8R25_07780 [Methanosarcinales archaeon]|nr:hypothetical protein [Methanosarcinales archaeon]